MVGDLLLFCLQCNIGVDLALAPWGAGRQPQILMQGEFALHGRGRLTGVQGRLERYATLGALQGAPPRKKGDNPIRLSYGKYIGNLRSRGCMFTYKTTAM